MKNLFVPGGAGFIGSHFVDLCLAQGYSVTVFDALTYAGRSSNLDSALATGRCRLVRGDIRDAAALRSALEGEKFSAVVNFAAESHVDRSISGPADFITTNILGVYHLLEETLRHWSALSDAEKSTFRYLQVSTDEVYGSLGDTGKFNEETPYAPNSPYSASKAGGDHLVRAWNHTFQLPVLTTHCTNNYGTRQFPEKLIPHMIHCALTGKPLPVYGTGKNIRDWIHVEDHCAGILLALEKGRVGEVYGFGGNCEKTNLEVVQEICRILDELRPRAQGSYAEQIQFVTDRKGHDWRYAIDDSKAQKELGYRRKITRFEDGLRATVKGYLEELS